MKPINSLYFGLSLASFAILASAGIVYQENFQNYNTVAPNVNAAAGPYVDNEPIWARGANIQFHPAEGVSCLAFSNDIALPAANKFDVHFRYRILNSKAAKPAQPAKGDKPATPAEAADPSYFDLVLKNAKGRELKIRIASDKVAGQPVAWEDARTWVAFALKANGPKADVFYAHDRAFRKIATIDLPDEYVSLNVGVSAKRDFALTDFVVQTPGALPSHPVDKHFANFRSLTQPIVNAKVVADATESIGLNPSPRSGIRFSLGSTNVVEATALTICWNAPSKEGAKDETQVYPIRVAPQGHKLFLPAGNYAKGQNVSLPDARIMFGKLFMQSVRPDLQMYCSSYDMEPQGVDVIREWNRLPAASRHPLDLDFERTDDGKLLVWCDGSLVSTLTRNDTVVTNVVLTLPRGARYAVKPDIRKDVDASRFTLIDLSTNPRAKAFADAKSSIPAGRRDFNGVPIVVADPIDSADIAICKQGKGNWALECEEYHGRSPLHGFPSAVHFRLPAADYCRAHLLVAFDPDPRKDAFLTVRMGHYITHGSGANLLGDAVIDLRGGKIPDSFRQVGTVRRGNKDLPLYLVKVDLNLGPVLDLASGIRYDSFSGGYIDFEFTGKGWENYEQIDRTMKPDPNSDSAFNIFGVTLEKLPVRITFRQDQPGNVFTLDEAGRKTAFIVTALRDGVKGKVEWTARDADGAEVFSGAKDYALAKAGTSNIVDIALAGAKEPGYYTLAVSFTDAATGSAFTHDAAFAVMPPAGRRVSKWDSPYATWWFTSHGSPGAASIGGPIMQKAGIVRASANGSLKKEDYEKYNITDYRIAYVKLQSRNGALVPGKVTEPDPSDPTGKKTVTKEYPAEEAALKNLRKAIESHPQIDTVMLWHESAPGYGIPEELLGMPVTQEQLDSDKALGEIVTTAGRVVRKVEAETGRKLTLQIGNSNTSIGAALRPLRGGAKVSSYDRIGIESPSQVIPPERLTEVSLQGMRIAYDAADYYAKKQNLPPPKINGSWEFTYRCDRDMGERQQAEWYVRDVLISLANDFFYISPGILFDCKNGYYNDLWGGSGILRRSPFCYPKQAYVAYGVLTKCLDGVKFVRQIDTGSTTVYALEFKRLDGKTVTALWAARGEVAFALSGVKGGVATKMLGRSENLPDGAAVVDGGTSPVYVETDAPLEGVTIAKRGFAKDEALAARAKMAWGAGDLPEAILDPDLSMETKHHAFLPILKPGAFSLAAVPIADGVPTREMVYEVTLDTSTNADVSKYVTEYTTIRFKEPKPIPGRPSVIGCWVRGNSNWGQIRFEIEDAQGEVFKNLTTGRSWGCDIMDWPGNLAVDFDGWSFVHTALSQTSLMNDHSPGPVSEQWVSEGGDKKIDLPVKIRAITVGMNRMKLDLLDFKESAPSILIGCVGGVEEPLAE